MYPQADQVCGSMLWAEIFSYLLFIASIEKGYVGQSASGTQDTLGTGLILPSIDDVAIIF